MSSMRLSALVVSEVVILEISTLTAMGRSVITNCCWFRYKAKLRIKMQKPRYQRRERASADDRSFSRNVRLNGNSTNTEIGSLGNDENENAR